MQRQFVISITAAFLLLHHCVHLQEDSNENIHVITHRPTEEPSKNESLLFQLIVDFGKTKQKLEDVESKYVQIEEQNTHLREDLNTEQGQFRSYLKFLTNISDEVKELKEKADQNMNDKETIKQEIKKISERNDENARNLQLIMKKIDDEKLDAKIQTQEIKRQIDEINEKMVEEQVKKINDENSINTNKINSLEGEIKKNKLPADCKEIQKINENLKPSGVYKIEPKERIFDVMCDMDIKRGGWTVVLNRFDGSVNFELKWEDYKRGFGNLNGEFWLGLENLHELTSIKTNELLFELVDWTETIVYAHYTDFTISDEKSGYILNYDDFVEGAAEDSLFYQQGMKFSTSDKDQDEAPWNCAGAYGGGWWHKDCFNSFLTGKYTQNTNNASSRGIHWKSFHDLDYSLKRARMMIRPQ